MKNKLFGRLLGAGSVMAILFAASPEAGAVLYNFINITNNGSPDIGGQLSMDVTVSGENVSFQFFNNVGIASSIAENYFDDGFLSGLPVITDSDGAGDSVRYVTGAIPSNLPGGNTLDPAFVATEMFNSEFDKNPAQGVNAPGEWVTLTFGLGSYSDLDSILGALDSGDLRIGMHLVAFDDGGSDSMSTIRPWGSRTVGRLLSCLVRR